MEQLKTPVVELTDSVREYLDVNLEIYKHKATEKSAELVSATITHLLVAVLVCFILLFTGIAAGIQLGRYFGELYLGFLAVGGFYSLLLLIVMILRKNWLKNRITDSFIKAVYSE
jgi:hypothetical protein